MDLLTGFVDISKFEGVTSPDYRVFTLECKTSYERYLLYLLQLCYVAKIFFPLGQGAATIGRWRLPTEAFNEFVAPIPTRSEQKSIANFLDHETAKIDKLIEKQQQLIVLLKEKRQAVISHAVTKGLNPKVRMKDSGVEWLGNIPEKWGVIRLKYRTTIFEQGWSPQCDSRPAHEDEYGVLKVGCVNHGYFDPMENKALPKEIIPQTQYLIQANDLLISRANTRELVGSAAVVDKNYDNLILCDKLYRLRFDSTINANFVAHYLALPIVRGQIELGASGASHTMQNIGQSTIRELPMVCPPTDEVEAVLCGIQKKISTFKSCIELAVKQIAFLQERRTALISAAVTGKIDVRNWVAPEQNRDNKEVAA
jgi:type I restriction enzyme S subunit